MQQLDLVFEAARLPQPLAAMLESDAIIVTPNNRLARRIAALHGNTQRARGRIGWPAPAVLPWSAWLDGLWLDAIAADVDEAPPQRIGRAQASYLWSRIVDDEGLQLHDRRGAVALAEDAWALLRAWGAGGSSWRAWAAGDDDVALFARWADRYMAAVARRNGLDDAELADWIARNARNVAAWRNATVALTGFLELAPQQQRLLEAMSQAGARIVRMSSVRPDAEKSIARAQRVECATPKDELACALTWARQRVLADPTATVAIAISDLSTRGAEVRALADEILCPALQWPGHEEAERPYNVSFGTAASEVPLIAAALEWIALAGAPMPISRAAALLRSPYLLADPNAWIARARFEATWLVEGRREVSLDDVISAIERGDDALAHRLRVARNEFSQTTNTTARAWVSAWQVWLTAMSWPGGRPMSSHEWQARALWDDLLAEFATLGSIAPRLRSSDALGAIVAIAKKTVFQPESSPAPVQILGFLEAAGLPLDGLWVAGLGADSWPPPPLPNPLLPIGWQRERNVPHATAARELAYARTLTEQWASAADDVVFSFSQSLDDQLRSISSLALCARPMSVDPALPVTARVQLDAAPTLESLIDDRAPTLMRGVRAPGGAGLVNAQSECPFRAMALYRLRTEVWPPPLSGLSPVERGWIVHAALAAFWRATSDHASFVSLSRDELAERIDAAAAVGIAVVPAARWRRLVPVVRAGEAARVARIVGDWLENFERERPPFAVAEIEAQRLLRLGGIELSLRVDRVDALADGGHAIIDYKTGIALAVAKWFERRPQAPQIGLYVLSQDEMTSEPVRAATYAQVKSGELKLFGIAADRPAWPRLTLPESIKGAGLADWAAIESRWRASLGGLADEVREGYAAVMPRDGETCRRCGMQSLCRIGAQIGDAGEGDG